MAYDIGNLYVKLSADASKLVNEVGNASKSLNKLEIAARNIQNSLLGIFGAQMLINGIRSTVTTLAEFDKTMTQVRVITNSSSEDFGKLEKSALKLGSTTQFTAKQIGELQLEFGRLGFSTKEILQSTEAVVNLATATGEGLARAAEIAGSTLRAFGLDASEMYRVTDVMASSLNNSALTLDSFAESIKYVSPVAKSAGVSLEETASMLGVLADAGIKGSQAGTSLRRIFTLLGDETKTVKEKMNELAKSGITLAQANDEVGLYAQTALLILTEQAAKVEDLDKKIRAAGGSTKDMAKAMEDNLATSLVKVGTAYDSLILSFQNSKGFLKEQADEAASFFLIIKKLLNPDEGTLDAILKARGGSLQNLAKELYKVEDAIDKVNKENEELIESLAKGYVDEFGNNIAAIEKDINSSIQTSINKKEILTKVGEILNKQLEDENKKIVENTVNTIDNNKAKKEAIDLAYKLSEAERDARITKFEATQKRQLSGDTTDYASLYRNFIPFSTGEKSPLSSMQSPDGITKNLDAVKAMKTAQDALTESIKRQNEVQNANNKAIEERTANWVKFAEGAAYSIQQVIAADKELGMSVKKVAADIISQNAVVIASWIAAKFAKDSATKTPVVAIAALTATLGVISGLLGKEWRNSTKASSEPKVRSSMYSQGSTGFSGVIRGQDLYVSGSNYQKYNRSTSFIGG